ncbi:MAG: hypothetical protein H0U04_08010 [Rubrobacter sp.]|nr:hypothetical protein [Rubrobacter sp.]
MESRRISEKQVFRFMHLTDDVLADLLEAVKGKEGLEAPRVNPQYGAPEKYAVWDLEEGADYRWIKDFVQMNGIDEDTYGVLISLVTEEESGKIRAPRFVIDLSREVGGVIDFSFTCVV